MYLQTDVLLVCSGQWSLLSFERKKKKYVGTVRELTTIRRLLSCLWGLKLITRRTSSLLRNLPRISRSNCCRAGCQYVALSGKAWRMCLTNPSVLPWSLWETKSCRSGPLWTSLQSSFCTAGVDLILKTLCNSNKRSTIKIHSCYNDECPELILHALLWEQGLGMWPSFALPVLGNFE